MNPVHVVFGVPVEFDMDLINWKQQSAMRKQYAVNPWKLHASFARGLCWLLKQPGELLFFPSWSWTGWTGSLSNWMSFETLSKQEDPEITFKIKFHGGTQDLHSAWTNSLGNLHYMSNDTLDIEAWSFPITIVPEPSQTDTQSSISYSSSYLAQLDLGSGMIAYSPFLVTEQVTEYLHDKLCSKTWTCIVLAYRKQASRAPVVLVLRESTKYAERIGLVDFWTAWGSDEYGNRYHIVVDDRKIVRSRWKGALW
ncbi:hypothetical protein K469DRAFT_723622 [Zopfia rhizophila CBS 207.26]|uniref:Heterokaryon incompatibility domain-containing protein n=1 Tax=Zopfia rhizophila CBS 207.26 TaxID=1314779 RepID=A0A6A6ECI0_9PEZI|nr:hypothetical protein K469DRAFT_723622 [Zopfia rhizophila CBS 207.26]